LCFLNLLYPVIIYFSIENVPYANVKNNKLLVKCVGAMLPPPAGILVLFSLRMYSALLGSSVHNDHLIFACFADYMRNHI
jgi:hypothetical protein